jgi:hypothetical protein
MIVSPPLDGTGDTAMKPWVLPAVAGVVLAAVVATACVCIFAISLPIIPVLAVCGPVAAALIGFIVWRIKNSEITPSSNAEIGNRKSGNGESEDSEESGEGNGLEDSIPDVEDIANGDQGFNRLTIRELKFIGCRRDGKFLFEGLDAGWSSFSFAAKGFDVALEKCSNVTCLAFHGNVPTGLEIQAASAGNLVHLKFVNIPNVSTIMVPALFRSLPPSLKTVIFRDCRGLTDATVIPHTETHFEDCNKLCTIHVGNGPYNSPYSERTHSVLLGEIPSNLDSKPTLINVRNCSSFNADPNGTKCIREFNLLESKVEMLANDTFVLHTLHNNGDSRGDRIACTTDMQSATKIPPSYREVTGVKIFSKPVESKGGILFQLPGDLSATEEVKIVYQTENDAIGKCILDLSQPEFIGLDSAAVKHIVLIHRKKPDNKKVECSVSYTPSDDSIVEFENFTCAEDDDGDVYNLVRSDRRGGGKAVNLPKIMRDGKNLEVIWFRSGYSLHPIIPEKAGDFQTLNKDATELQCDGKWRAINHLIFVSPWLT